MPVAYRSAIALPLAARLGVSPLSVARAVVAHLPEALRAAEFVVDVLPSGWIEFYPSDRAIALWLQHLLSSPWSHEGVGDGGIRRYGETEIFCAQYTYARCCSLLRLGHREKSIELDGSEEKVPPWQWIEPHPVPWLTPSSENASEAATLCLKQPAEQRLIFQVSSAVDALSGEPRGEGFKIILRTSEAFLEFDRTCRMGGNVKVDLPELARSRLGLVAVIQIVFAQFFRQLGVEGLVEL